MVTWDTIECIERNGIITGYIVVFQEQGGANVTGNTVDRTFSATGLTPFTNYVIQVESMMLAQDPSLTLSLLMRKVCYSIEYYNEVT